MTDYLADALQEIDAASEAYAAACVTENKLFEESENLRLREDESRRKLVECRTRLEAATQKLINLKLQQ